PAPDPIKKPSRWALTNWPVRWKVFAIVLVPLLLIATFAGLRVYSGVAENAELRRAVDRAEVIPPVVDYMAALAESLVDATSTRGRQPALARRDDRQPEPREGDRPGEIVPVAPAAVDAVRDVGQDVINKVMVNVVGLRQRVTACAVLLLTAETAI